jgi:hypothetical protein
MKYFCTRLATCFGLRLPRARAIFSHRCEATASSGYSINNLQIICQNLKKKQIRFISKMKIEKLEEDFVIQKKKKF